MKLFSAISSRWKPTLRFISSRAATLLASALFLFFSASVLAQHGGGHSGGAPMTGAGLSSSGRPDGVDEKDDLKTFHAAMEAQATSDQASAFRVIVKNTEAVGERLGSFAKESDASRAGGMATELRESLEKVRAQTKNFVDALSVRQKAALRETTARLEKAGAELAEQGKTLDGGGVATAREEGGRASGVKKSLENFRNQQDQLALEMGIVLSDADVAFTIPAFKTSTAVGGQRIAILSSTVITRSGTEDGENKYKIVLTADLSDLEPNLTAALGTALNGGDRCGERYSVEDATLGRSTGTSVVVTTKMYAERWACSRSLGERELAEGRGSADVKATPVLGTNGQVEIRTEMGATEAKGFLEDSLHGGVLGPKLQQMVAWLLETAIRATDFKATLPAAGANVAKMQTARFQGTEGGDLNVILEGEMKMSEEQVKALGDQLRERVRLQAVGAAQGLQK